MARTLQLTAAFAAAAIALTATPAFAKPLSLAPQAYRTPSIFDRVLRDAPAARETPYEATEEEANNAELPANLRRQIVNLPDARSARHDRHRHAEHLSLFRARRRQGDALRHRRRPRRLHLGGRQDTSSARPSGRTGSAGRDDRAPALSAALHGRRSGQSARRARHVSRRHRISHPRHQRAVHHRQAGVERLHPSGQRRREDLYSRVKVGAKVVVLPGSPAQLAAHWHTRTAGL